MEMSDKNISPKPQCDPEETAAKTILLINDDGIYAPGLWAMHRALAGRGYHVDVVAPDRERSAVGHGLTLHRPLMAEKIMVNGQGEGWAVAGTPADCVKLAVAELLPCRPAMVVSGINPGANVGINLNYSGTVAAAREAALCGIKAMAVSVQYAQQPRFEAAAEFAAALAARLLTVPFKPGTFINVNVPDLPLDAVTRARVAVQGNGYYDEQFEKRRDPRRQTYYWYGIPPKCLPPDAALSHPDRDDTLLEAGYVTITPLKCDMTDYESLEELEFEAIADWPKKEG